MGVDYGGTFVYDGIRVYNGTGHLKTGHLLSLSHGLDWEYLLIRVMG